MTEAENGRDTFEIAESQAMEEAKLEIELIRIRIDLVQEPSAMVLVGPTGEKFKVRDLEELGEGDVQLGFIRYLATSLDPEEDSWNDGNEIIH